MEALFTEEQDGLRAAVRALLAERCGREQVRRAMASETGADLELYRRLLALGVTDLPGLVEVGIVLEECGRAIAPVPLCGAVGVAGPACEAGGLGELADGLRSGAVIPVLALDGEASCRDGRARGRFHRVPEAHVADVVAFVAVDGEDTRLVAVDAAACAIEVQPTMDATRRLCTVAVDGAVGAVGPSGRGGAAVEAARVCGAVALAHELVGVGQACLDLAVAYAKTREQFGRPIGAYQAVSHRCVDLFVAVESARGLAYYAAWAVDAGGPDAALAASRAKAAAGDAAVACAQGAVQVHGGIGFTWEHDLHLYLRRARSGAALLGTASDHRRRTADLMGV